MAKVQLEKLEQLAGTAGYDSNKLAKLYNLSTRQLQRNFRRNLGRSPQDWLNEQRIKTAQKMLITGESVKKVALDLGFKQSSHFCRQFKFIIKMTPSQFADLNVEVIRVAHG